MYLTRLFNDSKITNFSMKISRPLKKKTVIEKLFDTKNHLLFNYSIQYNETRIHKRELIELD